MAETQRLRTVRLLCKADLQPNGWGISSLQGHVRLLAEFDGENEEVSNAMEGHYFLLIMGIPNAARHCRRFADRWDTLINCFRLGLAPKGSGDPLGLRRAANGFLLPASMEKHHLNSKLCLEVELDDALYDFLSPD